MNVQIYYLLMRIKAGNLENEKTTGDKGQNSTCAAIATLMESLLTCSRVKYYLHCLLGHTWHGNKCKGSSETKVWRKNGKTHFAVANANRWAKTNVMHFFYVFLRINHLCYNPIYGMFYIHSDSSCTWVYCICY